jgi:hypothetical protein
MGTGQMLLTVMAVFLLTTIILTNTRSYVTNTEVIVKTKMNLISIGLATSQIDRISRMAFDQQTVANNDTSVDPSPVDSLSQLSAILGKETGETAPAGKRKDSLFNDVDDYNGYSDIISTVSGDSFYVKCFVFYVDSLDPFGPALTRKSFTKRIDVRVWPKFRGSSIDSVDTIFLTKSVGFWRWR